MSKWNPCLVHEWEESALGGHYRCINCLAVGFRRPIVNPLTNVETEECQVTPYKCPGCGGATMEKSKPCPNCEGAPKEAKKPSVSEIQKEILETLIGGPAYSPLSQEWVGAITPLKQRGLVKRKQVIEWTITDAGKAILEDVE